MSYVSKKGWQPGLYNKRHNAIQNRKNKQEPQYELSSESSLVVLAIGFFLFIVFIFICI